MDREVRVVREVVREVREVVREIHYGYLRPT